MSTAVLTSDEEALDEVAILLLQELAADYPELVAALNRVG